MRWRQVKLYPHGLLVSVAVLVGREEAVAMSRTGVAVGGRGVGSGGGAVGGAGVGVGVTAVAVGWVVGGAGAVTSATTRAMPDGVGERAGSVTGALGLNAAPRRVAGALVQATRNGCKSPTGMMRQRLTTNAMCATPCRSRSQRRRPEVLRTPSTHTEDSGYYIPLLSRLEEAGLSQTL